MCLHPKVSFISQRRKVSSRLLTCVYSSCVNSVNSAAAGLSDLWHMPEYCTERGKYGFSWLLCGFMAAGIRNVKMRLQRRVGYHTRCV